MGRKIRFGEVYHSNNYGNFIPLYKLDNGRIKIRFIQTGYEADVSIEAVYHGRVKDKYLPTIAGVGFIGDFEGKISHKENMILYHPWNDMLNRCYNTVDKDYPMYGGLGITVNHRWFNFTNFYYDAMKLQGYENKIKYPSLYCLDKDYLQMHIPKNQRVYSKDTCIWISRYDNITLMGRENSTSEYYGVTKHYNRYHARYSSNVDLGSYRDPIMAANAYNYYYKTHVLKDEHHNLEILNDVPDILPNIYTQYNLNAKLMCKLIEK